MTVATMHCFNKAGYPKERFESERAAKRALGKKRNYRNRRYPRVYACGCGGYHLTSLGQ